MRAIVIAAGFAAGFAPLAAPVLAHHGWGSYDAQNPVTIEGIVKRVEYANPHVHLDVAAGDKHWEATLAPPFRMDARGIGRGGLHVDMAVRLYGYPSRQNPGEMRAEWIEIAGKRTELR